MILVTLLCFYNAFLNHEFTNIASFHHTLWLQEDHSVLLSGARHDENMKLPKPFPSLGLQVLEVHKQLGTGSSYIILIEVSLRNNEIPCEEKEDHVHLSS